MPRNVAIGLGLMEFPFAGVGGFWRWVDLCEAGGIDSIWQTDRMVSREPILECMSVMAALAGRTHRLKFGVNVLSLAFRDPVLVAKQCATIDFLSKGRLLPGAEALFRRAGLPFPQDEGRKLIVPIDGLRFLFVKDTDVPTYVEYGVADCGVAGRDGG